MVRFVHSPETVVFVIDLDAEMSTEAARGYCRLDVVKHAITTFVLAKKRMCARHKFAIVTLVQDEALLLPFSCTSNTDDFLECLAQLQPAEPAAAAAAEQQFMSSDGSSSSKVFDFGSLIDAVEPLLHEHQQHGPPQQQQQQQQQQNEVLYVAGGTLTPAPALLSSTTPSSSSSSQPQQQQQHSLRVILIYGRSQLPLPELRTQQQQGLAMDCLYVHAKPQAGLNHAQEVYGALEELVDGLGVRAGHAPFIYEATAGRTMKLLTCMALLLAHPQQRQPQADTKQPLDISAAPFMQLPSDLANLASGVPIMTASKLPAPAAASAWSKPLVVSNDTVSDSVIDTAADAAQLDAWGLPAAAAAGAGSSAAATAWGMTAPSAAAATAAAGSAWSNPRVEAGADLGSFAGSSLLYAEQTQPNPATAAAGAEASSSNGTKAAATVTGVPAGIVQGVPDRVPSYSLDDGLMAVGFAVPDQEAAVAAAEARRSLAGAAGSSAAAAAATAPLNDAAAGNPASGASGLDVEGSIVDEGLEGLAAALSEAAVDEGAAAAAAANGGQQ